MFVSFSTYVKCKALFCPASGASVASSFAFNVDLPIDYFFVFSGSKGVFIGNGADLFRSEELTKKANKVTLVACGAFNI